MTFSERPGDMRRRPDEFRTRSQAPVTPADLSIAGARRTRSGRRMGSIDNGTVALAVSGMAFYWMMPMLMSRGKARRRRTAQQRGP